MQKYSFIQLLRHALGSNRGWNPAWRDATPRGQHDSGNSGRNTRVTRSNYFYPESLALYDRSLQLYETLGHELDFNVMLRQQGVLQLAHSEHERETVRRWVNSVRVYGIESEELSPAQIKKRVPNINLDCRFPIVGGVVQERGGISRHDAVVWGYARGASGLGVDIIQGCSVKALRRSGDRIVGVETNLGRIDSGKVVMPVAGHSAELAAHAPSVGFTGSLTTVPDDIGWGTSAMNKTSHYVGKRSLSLQQSSGSESGLCIVEVDEAMVGLRINDGTARELLSQGTGLDLHPGAFSPGRCARTRLTQIPGSLHAIDHRRLLRES